MSMLRHVARTLGSREVLATTSAAGVLSAVWDAADGAHPHIAAVIFGIAGAFIAGWLIESRK